MMSRAEYRQWFNAHKYGEQMRAILKQKYDLEASSATRSSVYVAFGWVDGEDTPRMYYAIPGAESWDSVSIPLGREGDPSWRGIDLEAVAEKLLLLI